MEELASPRLKSEKKFAIARHSYQSEHDRGNEQTEAARFFVAKQFRDHDCTSKTLEFGFKIVALMQKNGEISLRRMWLSAGLVPIFQGCTRYPMASDVRFIDYLIIIVYFLFVLGIGFR